MTDRRRGCFEDEQRVTRRDALKRTVGAAAGVMTLSGLASSYAANERLELALVGAGGRGGWFARNVTGWGHVLTAVCDVDDVRAAEAYELHKDSQRFRDARTMIDRLGGKLQGVIVATPDHTHAPTAAYALRAGLPTYCEKPLTHDVHEARVLGRLAAEKNVATQLGNQGTASPAFHRAARCIRAGQLGKIRRVYAWNTGANATLVPPDERPPIPEGVSWDLWLGPAADRPYHPSYLKGRWHPWADFGTGVLGNWACHTLNLPFYALRIGELWAARNAEIGLRCECAQFNGHTLPSWMKLTWSVPERDGLEAVEIQWANGSSRDLEGIGYRATLESLIGHRLDWSSSDGDSEWKHWAGVLVVGEEGIIHANAHNTEMWLLPESKFSDALLPGGETPRLLGHEAEWFAAIKAGSRPTSNFADHGGPLTEFVLLGNIACRVKENQITYQPSSGGVVDHAEASVLLSRQYRKGWSL